MKIIYSTILACTIMSCAADKSENSEKEDSSSSKSISADISSEEVIETVAEVSPHLNDPNLEMGIEEANVTAVGMEAKKELDNSIPVTPILEEEDMEVAPDIVAVESAITQTENTAKEIVETVSSEDNIPLVASKVDHLAWDALVRKNVGSNGKVNYKGFKSNASALNDYLAQLSKEAPGSDWSRNEKLAYWINAYNAYTVKLIVDNYPLKSITDIPKAWDTKNIKIDGKMYSLGGIENDILRKMNEPRIHFAINCASISCPNLLNKAFLADKMSSQLSLVTKSFFNDGTKNDFSGKTAKISKLFDWYGADFAKGDILKYINSSRTEQLSDKTKISYLEYDWSLNE